MLWGHAGESIDKIQKKAIRTITYSSYIAHSEPLLKSLNLLKVKDLFNLKILKFLFNLYHNKLPPYFNNYRLDLEKIETPYALRLHPLPVPRVSHAYAEAGLVYQLVIMQNKITVSDNIISRRIHDPNYSLAGFNQLLINKMLDNYSYDCPLAICHTCTNSTTMNTYTRNLYLCCVCMYYLLVCTLYLKAVSLYLVIYICVVCACITYVPFTLKQ